MIKFIILNQKTYFYIATIFPEFFSPLFNCGIMGKAFNKKWFMTLIDLKKLGEKNLDSPPFGGGPGMIIKPDIVSKSMKGVKAEKYIYMSPRGKPLNQEKVLELNQYNSLFIFCGRYEGVDYRAIKYHNMEEISIGDFILCGGEAAALTMLEAILRLKPSMVNNHNSLLEESFTDFLLEHDQYTHPRVWNNLSVPEVLLSGHKKKIEDFQYQNSLERTCARQDLKDKHFLIFFIYIILLYIVASNRKRKNLFS